MSALADDRPAAPMPCCALPKNHGQRHRRTRRKSCHHRCRARPNHPANLALAIQASLARRDDGVSEAPWHPLLACILAYACTATGPAAGAAAAVCVSHALSRLGVDPSLAAAVTAFLCAGVACAVGAVCTAAATRVLGRRWRAAVGDDGQAIIADDVGTVAGARRDLRKNLPKQTLKHTVKAGVLAQATSALGAGPPLALAVAAAVAAAVVGAVAAALTLAREPSPRTARTAALKTLLKTSVSASAKALLKHHGVCGAVAGAALGSGLGTALRNAAVDLFFPSDAIAAQPASPPASPDLRPTSGAREAQQRRWNVGG